MLVDLPAARPPALRRLGKRLEVRSHGRRLGDGVEDRLLDVLGDAVSLVELRSPGSFRWSEISVRPSMVGR